MVFASSYVYVAMCISLEAFYLTNIKWLCGWENISYTIAIIFMEMSQDLLHLHYKTCSIDRFHI